MGPLIVFNVIPHKQQISSFWWGRSYCENLRERRLAYSEL